MDIYDLLEKKISKNLEQKMKENSITNIEVEKAEGKVYLLKLWDTNNYRKLILPKDVLNTLGLKKGDYVYSFVTDDAWVISKNNTNGIATKLYYSGYADRTSLCIGLSKYIQHFPIIKKIIETKTVLLWVKDDKIFVVPIDIQEMLKKHLSKLVEGNLDIDKVNLKIG